MHGHSPRDWVKKSGVQILVVVSKRLTLVVLDQGPDGVKLERFAEPELAVLLRNFHLKKFDDVSDV